MAKKNRKSAKRTERAQEQPEQIAPAAVDDISEAQPLETNGLSNLWLGGSFLVMATAVFLRLYQLGIKTFHHDEGVNGFFLINLFRNGIYKYDPTNYHGPTLYYFALFSSYIFGLNDFAVRFVTTLFGILTVALVLTLRRYLGTVGALAAGLLVALSPGLVFISRYFIHEILFLFFTLAVVVCVLKFIEGERPGFTAIGAMSLLLFICLLPGALNFATLAGGASEEAVFVARVVFLIVETVVVYLIVHSLLGWNDGRPIYLLLASASVMMTFATKETAFISFGTMLIALGCVWVWLRLASEEATGRATRGAILLGVHAVLLLAALYFSAAIRGGFASLYETYVVDLAGKEQSLIFVAIIALMLAGVAAWLAYLISIFNDQSIETALAEPPELTYKTFFARFGEQQDALILIASSVAVFAFVGVLFFSSFFTHYEGIGAAFEAYNVWTKTGTKDHAQNGLWAYLKWLLNAEAGLLILGALGTLIAFWKTRHRFALFCALWAFGLLAAYTLIPYKTPWLGINFVLPLALIAGYGINELAISKQLWQRGAAVVLMTLSVGIALFQTVELNFYRFDDDTRPYVYAHTRRDYDQMVREIARITARAGTNKEASITVASPDYWPLPWTLREYKNAGFHGKIIDVATSEIVIGSVAQVADLEKAYSAHYEYVGTYALRPGVDLMLYARKDLTQ